MEPIFQISSLAFTSVIICVLLRKQQNVSSVLLSLCTSCLILIIAFQFLRPILDLIYQLRSMTQIDREVTKPMMKIVGIELVSQIAIHLCCDAGETALGQTVHISATILSIYAALPLLSSVLQTLQKILGIIS